MYDCPTENVQLFFKVKNSYYFNIQKLYTTLELKAHIRFNLKSYVGKVFLTD